MKYLFDKIINDKRMTSRGVNFVNNPALFSKYLRVFVVFVAFLSLYSPLQATHIVGGEIRYRHIESDMYEITLTFRRDCINGADNAAFDNPANVWIFNGNGNLKVNLGVNGRLKMNFNPDDTLNNVITSECGFEGTQVCVHETTYKENVRLPFNPGENGYILTYQRCCRNSTLENIVDPLDTGATWITHITPEAQQFGNDSPKFVQWPDVYICANENLSFDHSATDSDGDSLVYKLYTPFSGGTEADPIPTSAPNPPYNEITWKPPYSLSNLLGGDALQIDPVTGLLTGNPPLVGQFLVGILVEEYRDGVKIGELRRDFQYNVRVCSDPPTAIFEANDGNCDGPEVQFENMSLGGASYMWNFNYPSTDPAFQSTEENPFFVYDEPGVYDVQLIVTRGSDECKDEVIQQVAAIFSEIDVDYDVNILACQSGGGYKIRLTDRSVEVESGFDIIGQEWHITQMGITQTYIGPVVTLDIINEDFTVELQVESSTGCKKSSTMTFDIEDFDHIADFVFELDGCPDGSLASLAFGDVSDPLNLYDSPVGYNWTVVASNGTTTYTDSSFIVDVPVTDLITVTSTVDFGGGCMATITKEINLEDVRPQSTYTLIADGCPDDGTVDITLATASDSGLTFQSDWTIEVGGNTLTSTNSPYQLNIPKDSLMSLIVVTTFENGCKDTISESYIPGPFATISFDAEPFKVCLGDSITFVSNPNSNFTYTWEPMEGLYFTNPSDLSNPQVIGISNTLYNVTVSDGLCGVSASLDIIVLDDMNLSITGDSIVCDGVVSLTASGGIGEGDYQWSLTPDFSSVIATGITLNTSFDGQGQIYYMRFTGESCGDLYAEYEVRLSDVFDIVFNGNPVRVCLSDTVPLLSNPNPLLTYVWSPTDGLYFSDPLDGSTAMVIGIGNTTYNVTLSDDFCSLDTMIEVNIADAQSFTILGDSIVCDENVVLIASGAVGNGVYQWSLTPDFTTIIHEGDTLKTTLTGLSQIFYVQYTDKTCGDLLLSYSVRKYVFDLEYPTPFMICPGDTVQYTLFNLGEGPITISWQSDAHIISGGSTTTPSVGVGMDETDDFFLIFTATSPSGCEFTDSVSFVLMQNPVVDFTFTLSDCGEYEVCFDMMGTYNGFPAWDFGDPTTTQDKSLDEDPCYTYPGPGVYEVVLDNITTVCPFDKVVMTVTINDVIVLDPIADQVVCLEDSVHISASSPSLNVSYTWCSLEGDTIAVGPDYDEVVLEHYFVVLKGEDPNGCFDMDTIKISPFEFDIDDNVSEVFCFSENTEIEVLVNGTQDGYSFAWGPEDCVISGGNTGNPILIAPVDSKTFTVTITYDDLGCVFVKDYAITTTSFTVELTAAPDTVINQGDEVTISVLDPDDGYTYEWSDGTTGDVLVDTPQESTTYSVTVTDEKGCTAVDDIFIRVRIPECDENDVFIPTAFSPNEDGTNDILYVRSNFIDEMELLIYNRWGQEIFRTTDPKIGWDGTYQGKTLSPDVYAYTLRVVCINQEEFAKRGNVNLLK